MEFKSKSRKEILKLIEKAKINWSDSIDKFEKIGSERRPMYLKAQELEEILKWKLRGQFGRKSKVREKNTDENIEKITKAAFGLTHSDFEIETELKINTLRVLYGVGTPVASAILAMCFPQKYAVIDFRNWRQFFDEKKISFSVSDYLRYLRELKIYAKNFSIPIRDMDMALWQFDSDKNNDGMNMNYEFSNIIPK